jgi:hypothetical protein
VDARIQVDDRRLTIRADVRSLDELCTRLQGSMLRGDVDQLWLAGGGQLTINWRAVRLVQVLDEPPAHT